MPSQHSTALPSQGLRQTTPIRTLALGTLLALLGCASGAGPGQALPHMPIPGQWSAAASAPNPSASPTSLTQWWQRFNDPLLSDLVAQALQANTSIRSARAALQQSRALREVKGDSLLPRVNGSGSVQRGRSGDNDASNSFKVGLDASWEPDIFGGQRSALDASEFDAQAAETLLADAQVSLAAEVALAYLQLRGQQAQLMIARNSLTSQAETLQITDWRAQAGLITSLEVEQARAATEQTRAQIPLLEANISKTRHALAVLTGQTPDQLQALQAEPRALPQPPAELALNIPAQTLRQRADVRSAEHRISAALERVSAAQAARYPGFSIGGSIGLNALTLAGLGSGATVVSALLGSVSVPLFDGGAARAQVVAQEAVLEQARVNYESVVLTALKEVEDALVTLRGDRVRLTGLRAAATAAANADLLAQNRYSSGLIDFQTVLQTQRTLLSAQGSVAAAQADISADHVRLYKALGGGWQ